jgi:hypothetical protein
MPTYDVGLGSTWSKSPLPKWDMICEFMRKKSSFFTQGCAILFAHTTTLISPDRALKFFEFNSTPSPFLLVATPLLS